MKKIASFILLLSFIVPFSVLADGGMIIWPRDINLDQSAQNAIVAWNGEEEIIILSNSIQSDAKGTALRMVPLPSEPSEIKEGEFESFEKLTDLINEKIEKEKRNTKNLGFAQAGTEGDAVPGVEITFHDKIGAHDVTVVKVNNIEVFLKWIEDFAKDHGFSMEQEINCSDYSYENCPMVCKKDSCPSVCSPESEVCITVCGSPVCTGGKVKAHKVSDNFRKGIENYLKREINYFVFDVIAASEGEESINPLIYKFKSDYLYYPVLISGVSEISESKANIKVFFITENGILSGRSWTPYRGLGYQIELTQEELGEVSEDIVGLFESDVKVVTFDYYGSLKYFKKDLIFYPQIWERNLTLGSRGEDVKSLQKILINEDIWDSEVGATGYFGSITAKALARFQEQNKYYILRPLSLEKGTGYFGSKTIEVLRSGVSLDAEAKPQLQTMSWDRNLYLGAKGEDVKTLQELLIKEKVWERSDIEATGYFGTVTQTAVKKLQEKYRVKILESAGLSTGTGFVGPSTRKYLLEINK